MRHLIALALATTPAVVSFGSSPIPLPLPRECRGEFESPPSCECANSQAPRDLTHGSIGRRMAMAPIVTPEQAKAFMPLANVHFHLGAEHKAAAYADAHASENYDATHDTNLRELWRTTYLTQMRTQMADFRIPTYTFETGLDGESDHSLRPGFMCTKDGDNALTPDQLKPYDFQHCVNVSVGTTYEFHWVYSSAGMPGYMEDGLEWAVSGRGVVNPTLAVDAKVFLIANDDAYDVNPEALLRGVEPPRSDDAVMYMGSSTGTSYDNSVCSGYMATMHVDRSCIKLSARSLDSLCGIMSQRYGMVEDIKPHGSRKLVDPNYVVPWSEVHRIA